MRYNPFILIAGAAMILAAAFLFFYSPVSAPVASSQFGQQGSFWMLSDDDELQPIESTFGLRIDSLVSCSGIQTSAAGVFSCGSGGSGGGVSTTTANTWTQLQTFAAGINVNSETFTDLTGSGLTLSTGALTLDRTGAWTGTFDGQEGSYYLARANHTGSQLASTISDFTTAAQATISETITGIDYASGVFSITSGYGIPTTAKQTEWDTAYTNRITSATSPLSITSNAISITADGITDTQLAFNTGQNLTTASSPTFAGLTLTPLTSALLLTNGSGVLAEYAGTSCTNQFVRSISALGAATCATVANTDLANSSVSYGGVSVSLGAADATPAFNLADATSLPIATGVSGLGTGIASWLTTPSSANLATALTDETGTGSAVFSNAPTITGTTTIASVLTNMIGVAGATPTPLNPFYVNIPNSGAFVLDGEAAAVNSAAMKWFSGGAERAAFTYNDDADSLRMYTISGGIGLYADNITGRGITILTSSGNTGVGTSTPDHKLAIDGTGNIFTVVYNGLTKVISVVNSTLTGLGTWDLTGAILRLPYGSAPTISTNGDVGIDSTSNQVKYYSGSAARVLGDGNTYSSFTYSTTTAWTATTTLPLGPAYVAETWNGVQCFTDAGTLAVSFSDGTNVMNKANITTTPGVVSLTTNNTFTAGEKRYVAIGSAASSPTTISCTVSKSLTAD